MEKLRIDKFLSSQMNISRNDAKKLIKKNVVLINGVPIKKSDIILDGEKDIVSVNGKVITYKKHIYLMMNKPKGIVSASSSDTEKTVIDILPEKFLRSGLFPAGRLDKNTTGFVLITDDGEFAHDILSPAHHVPKTYVTELEREVTKNEFLLFKNGLIVCGEKFKPAELKFIKYKDSSEKPVYEITITEGRYHQIKRMFASTGNKVLELDRIRIGNLELDKNLLPGETREISASELGKIKNL